MVAHNSNPRTQGAEEVRSRIQGQPGIHSMALCGEGIGEGKGGMDGQRKGEKEGREGGRNGGRE